MGIQETRPLIVLTDSQAWIGVHGLHDLRALVVDDPVGINLGVALRIQHHGLVGPGEGIMVSYKQRNWGINVTD